MASEDVQPISDNSSRSDWFRQTVLFWSSQTTHCEGSEQALNEIGNPDMTSDLSSTESTSSLSPNNANEIRSDEGDYLLDLDITTSELLKQVEEFEYCFNELTKNDAHSDEIIIKNENSINSLADEDSYYSTLESETQSPHLTLEFPAGSSIRDSPLYTIIDPSTELGNKMDCSAECTAGEEKIRKVIIINDENTANNKLENKILITDSRSHAVLQNNKNSTINENNIEVNSMKDQADIIKDDRGDPNDVLRDLLSGIKPPNGICINTSPSPRQSIQPLSPAQGHDIVPELPIKESSKNANKCNGNDVFLSEAMKHVSGKSDVLLKQMDNLLQMEQAGRSSDMTPLKRMSLKNSHETLERLDSGLNGMSSDSNSPYPSPLVNRSPPSSDNIRHKSPGYDSGYVEQAVRNTADTIYESAKENEWDFPDDSDLSSDWSPLSTIDSADFSAASSKRSRSYSVPHTSQFAPPYHNRRTSTGNLSSQKKRANTTALSYPRFDGSPADAVYSESELSAIRKFLTLTRKYFDKGSAIGSKETGTCLDGLAMIPNINEIVEAQSKEVRDQREMLEGFIRQLGELLIEIVNLKDEQTAVRSKQAKALTLLKKQLDHHKKNQSQACNDILEQVNLLNEKLNSTLSTEQLCSTPISKNGSVKSTTSSKSPSPSAKSASKSPLPITSPHSTSSLTPTPGLRANNYGQIIWKITDVMRKITRIKSGVIDGTLVSSPFQTGEYQYNMNAWVYLNGRGKMVGKYVSVYACVLVGEYDAILSWPVTPTYKFTLIDQRSDPTKRQDHVRVRRVLDIAGRGENVISQNGGIPRPSDGSKALIVGLDDFIAHDQLLKNRYLVDDVIFLKVEAEIN